MDVVNLTGVSLAFVAAIIVLSVSLIVSPASASTNADDARSLLSEGIISYLSGGEGVATISDLRAAATLYPAYPRRITDTAGTAFIFYRPVERIIAMHPHAADAAIVLGVDRKIVGVTDTIRSKTLRFPELSKVTGIGRWTEPDVEAILALNPDLILTYVDYPEPEKLEDHLSGRIPVVRMDFYRAEVFRNEMVSFGRLLDEEEGLDEYLAWYDEILALVEERTRGIPDEERVRVYAESGSGHSYGRRAFSEGSGLHDLIVAAGGVNVAAGHFTGYADVEDEWVLHQNPDVILVWTTKGGYKLIDLEEIDSLRDGIRSMPGFERIPAVKDDRVYVVTSDFGFGLSSPAAIIMVASWFYPDRFDDIDPAAVHAEFLERFTFTGDEIKEIGIFYYPK